jgi:hypothetical protein
VLHDVCEAGFLAHSVAKGTAESDRCTVELGSIVTRAELIDPLRESENSNLARRQECLIAQFREAPLDAVLSDKKMAAATYDAIDGWVDGNSSCPHDKSPPWCVALQEV